jgi:2-keto-4-pentenoate hydratase/2-oxohepta-3-ene-1,7-dioic acid hydratase in catechol pathway
MSIRLISFRAEGGQAAAGIAIADKVVPAEKLPGLAGATSMLQVLERWESVRALINSPERVGEIAAKAGIEFSSLELLAPVPDPRALYCSGGNYTDHIEEMKSLGNVPKSAKIADVIGTRPWHFLKVPASCIVGPGAVVENPGGSQALEWEIELVAVIGKRTRNVSEAAALGCVAGYTIGNDLSARDRIARSELPPAAAFRFDWMSHKCFDGSFPCGPAIVPAEYVPDPQNLGMRLWVNDQIKQDSNTNCMVFSVAQQISHLSRYLTLHPGDLIATGTPAGVGAGRGVFLANGDRLRLQIDSLGEFAHSIAA